MRVLSFRFATRFLRSGFGRVAVSVVALAAGVALVCAVDLVSRAMLTAFEEVIETMAGRAALEVKAGESGLIPEDLASRVAVVPGVELAVPVVGATTFVADGSGELLTVHGVDVTDESAVRVYEAQGDDGTKVDDPLVFLSQPNSVIVTRAFAERRGLKQGSEIRLETPRGRRNFLIRGILEARGVGRVYGGNLLVMDLFAAEAAFAEPGFVNRVDVVVTRGARIDDVAAALRTTLPPAFRVDTPVQRKLDLRAVIRSLQTLMRGIGLVALVAAFLIAFNCLSSVFEGRAWQLGLLAAVGVRRRRVWLELVKESLLLGVAGVGLGIPAGVILAHVLLPVIATATALNYKLIAPDAKLILGFGSVALAASLGLAAAVVAAALPAWRAVRLGMAEILRSRGREEPGLSGRTVSITFLLMVLCATIAVTLQSATRSATWGLVATALIAMGTAVAARPIVPVLTALIAPALRRAAGASGRLAEAAIRDNPRRMALTAATLAVGLGSVFWLWILARSFERSVVAALGTAIRADLVVTSANIAAGFLEAPVSQDLAIEVARVPGVEAVAGWRAIEWPYRGGPVGISAYDPIYFRDREFGEWPLVESAPIDVWESVADGKGVVVSTSFVSAFGLGVGDAVSLSTPGGDLALPIVGITVDFVSARGTIEISREAFKRHWHDTQLTRLFLRASPGADLATIRARIATEFGSRYGLRILSSGELLDYFTAQVRRAFSVIPILGGTVLFVVLIGMADSLGAGVLGRMRELGMIRAQGVRRRFLRRMVLVEGLALSGMGIVLAAVSGLALGVLWVKATFAYLLGWALELHVPYLPLILATAITILVCAAGAWLPARQAARIEPAKALRYE